MAAVVASTAITALTAAACASAVGPAPRRLVPGGDAALGRQAVARYGCGSCHTIPGVRGADALVGPPLVHWSRRGTIAGRLSNTPDNLERWIRQPQSVEPGTDMPDLGVTAEDARNIVAYLFTLR